MRVEVLAPCSSAVVRVEVLAPCSLEAVVRVEVASLAPCCGVFEFSSQFLCRAESNACKEICRHNCDNVITSFTLLTVRDIHFVVITHRTLVFSGVPWKMLRQ